MAGYCTGDLPGDSMTGERSPCSCRSEDCLDGRGMDCSTASIMSSTGLSVKVVMVESWLMIVVAADGGLLVPSLLRCFPRVPFAFPSTRGFSGPGASCSARPTLLFFE